MENYFQGTPKHLLKSFFLTKVCLSVLGAAKIKSGYNTRCMSFCSAMTGTCAKLTVLMNWPENNF